MSYHIKSTPYFQRILTTSKLNGQLQVLKEEYERSNFINDYKIERKMREVRLKRLFKEIDKIREANSKKPNLEAKLIPRVKESKRLLNKWRKAKSLGQYYSERNLENTKCDADMTVNRKHLLYSKGKTEFVQKASFLKKGIKYGNEISDLNVKNIKLKNLQKELIQKHTNSQKKIPYESETTGRQYLCNNTDQINIDKNRSVAYKNQLCANKSLLSNKYIPSTFVIDLSENVQLIHIKSDNDNIFRSCDNLRETILVDKTNKRLGISSATEYIKVNRAIKRWRKTSQQLKTSESIKNKNDKPCVEYQLRSVSNSTNLLETDVIPSRTQQFNKNLVENDEDYNNELLFNSEYLVESNLAKSVDDDLPRYPPPPPSPPPISIPTLSHKKHTFKQILKPIEDNSIDSINSKNENFKLKVENLRSLFEHESK